MEITKDIVYLGVNDHAVDLFESQYSVPNGMAYNSYLIMDDQTVVMDTVDAHFTDEWITKIAAALGDRAPDYLVVQHMEPDHAGSIDAFAQAYPTTKIVSSAKAFVMMQQFFGTDYADRRIVVKEGDTLPLGHHTLHFVTAPMVHWPEVIMTYDDADKVLFSADAFGKFGALDVEEEWLPEARRYFIGIVGKYGVQVQAVLKKAATLPIETIAPLHGPVWRKNLGWFIGKYDLWSRCEPEEKAVVVLYGSMYGNTASAANALAAKVAAKGVKVAVHDLSCIDNSEAVAECWRASTIVLAAPTYNGGIYLPAANLLEDLKALNLHDRTFALVENGSWAPMSAKLMAAKIGELKNCTVLDAKVTVRGRLTATQDAELEACAAAVAASM